MKIKDHFEDNTKEIKELMKLKLNPTKELKEKILGNIPEESGTNYVSTIQLWRGKIIERVFDVRFKNNKKEFQEVIRRVEGNANILIKNMYYSGMNGYRTVWPKQKVSPYLWNEKDFDAWFIAHRVYYNVFRKHLFDINDLISLDGSLKYCAWDNQDVSEWVTIYRNYPEIEMLAKLGMKRLMYNQKVLDLLKEKRFKKYLYQCGGTGNTTGRDVLYGYSHNIPLSRVYKRRCIDGAVKKVIKAYPVIDKKSLRNYFEKWFDKDKHFHEMAVSNYLDMLEAETYWHLDLTVEKNAFPKDFTYWHDFYTKQMTAAKNASIDKEIEQTAEKYKKITKTIEGISLLLPHSTNDLILEGEKLSHCVGRTNYNQKIAKGESLILFVRKEENINEPLATMEFDPKTKKIIQLYGEHNTTPEERIKNIIYDKWLPKVKRMRLA